jgi:hypothetical protein
LTLKRGKGLPRPEKNEKTTTRLPKAGLPGKRPHENLAAAARFLDPEESCETARLISRFSGGNRRFRQSSRFCPRRPFGMIRDE